jgi:hypothetical protein
LSADSAAASTFGQQSVTISLSLKRSDIHSFQFILSKEVISLSD